MKKLLLTVSMLASLNAMAWYDCGLGEIKMFAGNFAPKGWAFTHGQTLSISQYQALYSILGTTYGGDGRTTFALPDTRGRAAVGFGQGVGLPFIDLGSAFGTTNMATKTETVKAVETGEETTNLVLIDESTHNYQPSVGLNYIICLEGTYPPRS